MPDPGIRTLDGDDAAEFARRLQESDLQIISASLGDGYGSTRISDATERRVLRFACLRSSPADRSSERDAGPQIRVDPSPNEIIGGITALIFGSYLHVKLLWTSEEARGRGVGRALVQRAEQEAHQLGCTNAVLDTFDFQAEGFYVKLGYVPYARLAGGMGGKSHRIRLAKSFPSFDSAAAVSLPSEGSLIVPYHSESLDLLIASGLEEHRAKVGSHFAPYNHQRLVLQYERTFNPTPDLPPAEGITGSSGGSFMHVATIVLASDLGSIEDRHAAYRALLTEAERIAIEERECNGILVEVFDTRADLLATLNEMGYVLLHELSGWFDGRLNQRVMFKSLMK